MPRVPARFTQASVARVARAVKALNRDGENPMALEIDTANGLIRVVPVESLPTLASPETDEDRYAKLAREIVL